MSDRKTLKDYPNLLNEWDYESNSEVLFPEIIPSKSNKKFYWKCKLGHLWPASPSDRTTSNTGCPYCSGNKVLAGFNDLATKFPDSLTEWDYEKNSIRPSEIAPFSGKKVWWKCDKGHSYEMSPSNKIGKHNGCPYCSNQKVLPGFNDVGTLFPEIYKWWDEEKNYPLTPKDFAGLNSNKRAWFVCSLGHSFNYMIKEFANDGQRCPYCANKRILVGFNDLTTTHPKLVKEWDTSKNSIKPTEVSYGSNKKVWWLCKNNHSWEASISSRASGRNCPYCTGQKVFAGFNDLQTLFPAVASQWDYEKNNGLMPSQVSSKTKSAVWWKCKCGHSYKMTVDKKTSRGFGCPICSNYRIVAGVNDLATTHPLLIDEWNLDKNGSITPQQIGRNSTKKFWWICQKGHEWQATPYDRTQDNTGCPICAARRNTSFPEQAIYFYLKKLYPDAVNRYKDIFNNGMELDIFIPSLRLGIEFDGLAFHNNDIQHKRELIKYEICRQNKIELIRIKEKHNNIWKDTADSVYFIPKEHSYKRLAYLIQHFLNVLDSKFHLLQALDLTPNSGIVLPPQSSIQVDLDKDRLEILSYLSDIPNSIAKIRPDVAEQWDYSKNKLLTPSMFSIGSTEKVWWICTKCGSSYKTTINHKNRNDTRVCPNCAKIKRGRSFTELKVEKVGSLRQTNPALAKEFHPTKNGDLTPDNITAGKFKYVWWKCSKCGYEWQASPNSRKRGTGCPHCSGRVPIPGVDDLLTLYPELCKEWDYSKNVISPSEVLPGSGKKGLVEMFEMWS